MVELRGVAKIYARRMGGRVHALRDASVQVAAGEMVAVVGPTHAGKSTLLRLVSGEERPSTGRVLVDGADVGALRRSALARLRRHLGIVPQEPRLLADRTTFGNVAVVLRALGLPPAEARSHALGALHDVGLAGRVNAFPNELTGSERRRLGLARALANEPRVLLADEPTATLDEGTARQVVAVLRAVNARGTTVLVATRAVRLADDLGARCVLLDSGRLRPVGRARVAD